jgi:hypothetical protein
MSCNVQHAITHYFEAFRMLQDESRQSIMEVPSIPLASGRGKASGGALRRGDLRQARRDIGKARQGGSPASRMGPINRSPRVHLETSPEKRN